MLFDQLVAAAPITGLQDDLRKKWIDESAIKSETGRSPGMENDWIFTCKIEPEEEESVVAVTDECEDKKDYLSVEDPEDVFGTSTNECVGCRKSLDLVKFIHSQRPEEVFLLLKCVDIFLANSNDDSECARCAEVLMLTKKIVEQRAYDVELSKCANDVETFIECCQSNLLKTELQENPFSDDDEPSVAEFNCLTYEDADLQEPIDSPATISALADPLELDTVNPSHTRKRKVDHIRVKSQDEMGPFPKYCQIAVKQPQIEAGGQLLLAGGAGPFSAWTVVGTLGTNHTVALTAARLCPTSGTSDLRGPCSFIANQTDDRTFDAAKLYPSSESSEGCREDSSSCEVAGAPESADPTGKPMNYLPVIEVPGRTKSSTLYHCVMDSDVKNCSTVIVEMETFEGGCMSDQQDGLDTKEFFAVDDKHEQHLRTCRGPDDLFSLNFAASIGVGEDVVVGSRRNEEPESSCEEGCFASGNNDDTFPGPHLTTAELVTQYLPEKMLRIIDESDVEMPSTSSAGSLTSLLAPATKEMRLINCLSLMEKTCVEMLKLMNDVTKNEAAISSREAAVLLREEALARKEERSYAESLKRIIREELTRFFDGPSVPKRLKEEKLTPSQLGFQIPIKTRAELLDFDTLLFDDDKREKLVFYMHHLKEARSPRSKAMHFLLMKCFHKRIMLQVYCCNDKSAKSIDDDDDEEEPCSDGPVRNVAERDAQQFKESQDDPDVLDRDHRPLNLQHRVMKEDLRIPLNKLQGLMSFFYTFFKMNPPPESPPNSRRRRRHKPSRHEVLDEEEESFVLGNRNPPKSLRPVWYFLIGDFQKCIVMIQIKNLCFAACFACLVYDAGMENCVLPVIVKIESAEGGCVQDGLDIKDFFSVDVKHEQHLQTCRGGMEELKEEFPFKTLDEKKAAMHDNPETHSSSVSCLEVETLRREVYITSDKTAAIDSSMEQNLEEPDESPVQAPSEEISQSSSAIHELPSAEVDESIKDGGAAVVQRRSQRIRQSKGQKRRRFSESTTSESDDGYDKEESPPAASKRGKQNEVHANSAVIS
ncbi:unnamed protein product [Notodromas monacha]|uniref:Uncharacterized protein n=1 Tax=Notodromas monacha TaxID=399045 RepID=A0A7R9BST7_9CRUS|nr:unnamed protein product [Notodromas monacha]CAG0919670.1 unnamed protein product [Notodromas monacha]